MSDARHIIVKSRISHRLDPPVVLGFIMSPALSAFADDNRGKAGPSRLLWQSHRDSGHLLTEAICKPMGERAH